MGGGFGHDHATAGDGFASNLTELLLDGVLEFGLVY
jgi:hypothetical protein